jgi:hypothetical protein
MFSQIIVNAILVEEKCGFISLVYFFGSTCQEARDAVSFFVLAC